MSERKAINKYYPPDFDPSKIIKKKKKVKTGSASLPTITLMTPFSMKCNNCGFYIPKSRKFNARKETLNEDYLGQKYVRFHIRCPQCASEVMFRTDPKSGSFVIEFGAKKNYDSGNTNQQMKDEKLEETLERLEKEEAEARQKELDKDKKHTSLEELEAKLNDIRHQQEFSEHLDELREYNARLNEMAANPELQKELKEKLKQAELIKLEKQNEEDEKLTEEAFKRKQIKPEIPPTLKSENKFDNDKVYTEKSNAEASSKSDSDSDSDGYDQPLFTKKPTPSQKISVKRKSNMLGINVKKMKK